MRSARGWTWCCTARGWGRRRRLSRNAAFPGGATGFDKPVALQGRIAEAGIFEDADFRRLPLADDDRDMKSCWCFTMLRRFPVMPGLVPGIHDFLGASTASRGSQAQGLG